MATESWKDGAGLHVLGRTWGGSRHAELLQAAVRSRLFFLLLKIITSTHFFPSPCCISCQKERQWVRCGTNFLPSVRSLFTLKKNKIRNSSVITLLASSKHANGKSICKRFLNQVAKNSADAQQEPSFGSSVPSLVSLSERVMYTAKGHLGGFCPSLHWQLASRCRKPNSNTIGP